MMSLRTSVDIHVEQAMEVVNTLHDVAKNIGRLFDWVAFVAPNIHDCRLTLVGCA